MGTSFTPTSAALLHLHDLFQLVPSPSVESAIPTLTAISGHIQQMAGLLNSIRRLFIRRGEGTHEIVKKIDLIIPRSYATGL